MIKLGKMLFAKHVRNNFPEILGEFLDAFRKILKSTENFGKMILDKFCGKNSVNYRQILDGFSEYCRFCNMINYLLTGLLVLYREILNPQFLRTELADSVRTSKLRA